MATLSLRGDRSFWRAPIPLELELLLPPSPPLLRGDRSFWRAPVPLELELLLPPSPPVSRGRSATGLWKTRTVSSLVSALEEIVGAENVFTTLESLEQFASDATFIERVPDLAVAPADTTETAAVVGELYSRGVAVTCRGAGTGLSGGAVAVEGGAVLLLHRLDGIEVDQKSMSATVGAGATTASLMAEANRHGLSYPPDPGSLDTCTIGGNIATNAGGPSCLKYGVTSDYVMGLVIVLAGGRVMRLGGKSRKRSAGYRLAQLFVGSEGTLGVITEATLRLVPAPSYRSVALAAFASIEAAASGVAALLGSGYLPAALELLDASSIAYVHDLLPPEFPVGAEAILLIEQDGGDVRAVDDELSKVQSVLVAEGAYSFVSGVSPASRELLWRARRSIGVRLLERRRFRVPEDIAVPIDRIPEMVKRIKDITDANGVSVAVFGHAGDGNLHPSLIFDDRNPDTLRRIGRAAMLILEAAIELGGTVSAEHGLGAAKRGFAEIELGEDAVGYMRGIKEIFDPKGLFNPGKVFPPSGVSPGEDFLEALPGWLH